MSDGDWMEAVFSDNDRVKVEPSVGKDNNELSDEVTNKSFPAGVLIISSLTYNIRFYTVKYLYVIGD